MSEAYNLKNMWGGVTSKSRDTNLELFRIMMMLLIVAHHYVVNSGLTAADGPIYVDPLSWRSIFLLLMGAWGKSGINCFVLITGYFMCKSNITLKKFLKLMLEVEFYKIVIYLIFLLSGYEPFTLMGLVKIFLPITGVAQNFTGCFLLFYLCIPFLNILIRNMTEKQHLYLIALVSFIYVILGTVPKIDVTMNYVTWFCVLYFISSYICLHSKKLFERTRIWGILMGLSVGISAVSVVACTWLSTKVGLKGLGYSYYFVADSNKILAIVTALCAFLFFKNVKIKQSKFINNVAASAFGVLLIHANSDTMRNWLWKDTLDNVGMYSSQWMVFHAVGSVIAIFAVCVCIDRIRIVLLEKPFFRLWDKKWECIRLGYKKMEEKLFMRMNVKEKG